MMTAEGSTLMTPLVKMLTLKKWRVGLVRKDWQGGGDTTLRQRGSRWLR